MSSNLKCATVGLGKLGLPLALVLAKKFDVVGYDINPERTVKIMKKQFENYKEKNLMEYLHKYPFKVTMNKNELMDREVIFCLVNTPSDPIEFSNKYIYDAIKDLYLPKCKLFVVVSTVMPGSIEKIKAMLPEHIKVCYNPEFIALGNVIDGIENPDFILIGEEDKVSGDLLENIYKHISNSPIKRMSWREAEITKIALNSYITMKITFANVIGEIANKFNCNGQTICDALGQDKRIGKSYLKPGAMYQGPCFPRDNRAFNSFLDKQNVRLNYCGITDKINEHQLERTLNKIKKVAKIEGTKISLIGMNYKVDSEETTESMGLKLNHLLQERGAITEIDQISPDTDLVIYCMPDKRALYPTDKQVIDLWE